MSAIVERALEPLNIDLRFQVLLHQKITNSFLVCRILLLITFLLFVGFLGFTCRDANTSVAQQLAVSGGEKRDLDHHVEVICSTAYKTDNWWIFFLYTLEIVCSFAMIFFLKVWLDKLAYYSCRRLRLPLAKYYERMVVFSHQDEDIKYLKRKLSLWMWGGTVGYLFFIVLNIVVPITSLILRYSINDFRKFILPRSKLCGPDLFWLSDDDFNTTVLCHFEQEWEVLYVVVSCWYRAFQSKYFKDKEDEYELDNEIMGL
uniref:Uncharacterized protein n=1 Tax=Vannella robusta TaxID=1487602 RepID=A0A7S4HY76_9EUKA|mmetsp:Transcript_17378/g.22119  ORF Transcript_17378/g.22119 Transcript_17378/m.22119 type:complete len:259 (+) Transcript_17378:18-794(+)